MVDNPGRTSSDERGPVPATVYRVSRHVQTAPAMTLVELLATLVIASILASVVIATISFEFKSWQNVVPDSNVRSNVAFTSRGLQDAVQNIIALREDPAFPSGTALIGQDTNGNAVEIRLQQPGSESVAMAGTTPLEGIVVTDTPVDGSHGQPTVSNKVFSFNDTSFAGTSFQASGSLVTIQIQATYLGDSTPVTYHLTESFALGGGS